MYLGKIFVATLSICLFACFDVARGQINYVNEFHLSSDGSYSWRPDSNTAAISPGGSFRSNNVAAEFSTFGEFINDVVGEWTVYRSSGAMVTFDLLPFEQSSFPQLNLLYPVDEQNILSGAKVESVVDSSVDLDGTSQGFSNTGGVDVDFLGGFNFRLTLDKGLDDWTVDYFVCGFKNEGGLVTSTMGETESISVAENVNFSTFHPSITLFVVNQLEPGDVNQDGVTDLLDVAPFVLLIVNSEFQGEADINQDGIVDLLDVALFVDLLSGS